MIKILITTIMRILCSVTILTVLGIHGEAEEIVVISISAVSFIWSITPLYYKVKHMVKLLFAKGEKAE